MIDLSPYFLRTLCVVVSFLYLAGSSWVDALFVFSFACTTCTLFHGLRQPLSGFRVFPGNGRAIAVSGEGGSL